MNEETSHEADDSGLTHQVVGRRLFLQSTGKWSGAAIAAVVAGSWIAMTPKAEAAGWVNRRGGGGGGWVNGGGGGGWVNRRGGGGWINGR